MSSLGLSTPPSAPHLYPQQSMSPIPANSHLVVERWSPAPRVGLGSSPVGVGVNECLSAGASDSRCVCLHHHALDGRWAGGMGPSHQQARVSAVLQVRPGVGATDVRGSMVQKEASHWDTETVTVGDRSPDSRRLQDDICSLQQSNTLVEGWVGAWVGWLVPGTLKISGPECH